MASFNFNSGVRGLVTGAIDADTDTFKCMVVTGAVLAETAKDTFDFRDDVTGIETSGTGYTAGGAVIALTTESLAGMASDNILNITSGAVSWTNSSFSGTGAIIYKARGGAATADELLSYIDFGGTVTSTNGTFTVTPTSSISISNT